MAPAFVGRPDVVPVALQAAAAKSMCAYVSGHLVGGSVPATVAALSEQVIRAMNIRTLKIVAAVVLAIGALGGTLPFVPRLIQACRRLTNGPRHTRGDRQGCRRESGRRSDCGRRSVHHGADAPDRHHGKRRTFHIPIEGGRAEDRLCPRVQGGARRPEVSRPGGEADAGEETSRSCSGPKRSSASYMTALRNRSTGRRSRSITCGGLEGKYDQNPFLENVVQGTPLESLFRTTTGKDGRFRFPAVPPPYRVVVKATADGMAEYTSEIPGDYEAGYIAGTVDQPAHLTMEPGARIKGRVASKIAGLNVAGLTVALQSTNDSVQFWRTVNLDADGTIHVRRIARRGRQYLPLPITRRTARGTYRGVDNLALHPGKTSEVTIELIERTMVTGKVIDANSGEPVPGLFVGMHGPSRPPVARRS